ncbi:uncharacterized protein LOC106089747 [Stomoxys calcitrans]|uniref:uncharacterized protein LOC106089747 n=1 Tax=Stomoxys calcitrans TaxID=35570 RepID=UPI0027E26ACE|nr:uncharacterized protein LOC106089747 [Stomoxys calcitrans]
MGDEGVGKSTLLHLYTQKIHFDLPYHDHRIDHQRYQIEVVEVLTFDQLHQHKMYENQLDIIIHVLCFDVTNRRSLDTLKRIWIPEIMGISSSRKIFLMGLKCDLREQFLAKLTQKCFNYEDGLQMCRYYENLHYVECSNLKLPSVNQAFDTILEIGLYEDAQKEIEARVLKLYATMQIKFQFYGDIKWRDQTVNEAIEDNTHPGEECFL